MNAGIAAVTCHNYTDELLERRVAIHEVGHLLGALDHYDEEVPGQEIPGSEDLKNATGLPYAEACIFGEEKDSYSVANNLTLCGGCKETIRQYLSSCGYIEE